MCINNVLFIWNHIEAEIYVNLFIAFAIKPNPC